jgi:uncharacterized protein involved in exopolysaccharide biosynthesis
MNSVDTADVSIFALGATLIKNRWRIMVWMLLGAAAAALTVLSRPRTYLASASFVSEGAETTRSNLASLAGQIGITVPTTSQTLSPDFYLSLLQSRVLLLTIARDTIEVAEMGGRRIPVLDLFQISPGPAERREERGVRALQSVVAPSVAKATGVISVDVSTKWRSVSLAIVTRLLEGVNDYNEQTRQGRAISERKFVEATLVQATRELREAENRLAAFLKANRQYGSAPDLMLEHGRLTRGVDHQQQLFTTLMQSYEEARIREIRDTPVITVFEPPFAPTLPKPRGLVIGTMIGLVLGALIGILLSLTRGLLRRRRTSGNTDAEEFDLALSEAKAQLVGLVRRPRRHAAAGPNRVP